MRYKITARESGDVIERWLTLAQAQDTVARFEREDMRNGAYEPRFYSIEEEEASDRETFTARVSAHGNSLNINCTEYIHRMGLDRGDRVEVTLRRV